MAVAEKRKAKAREVYKLLVSTEEGRKEMAERKRLEQKSWREANPEERKARANRAYRHAVSTEEGRKKLAESKKDYARAWRAANPEKVKAQLERAAAKRREKYAVDPEMRRKLREYARLPDVKLRKADQVREQRYHVSPGRFAEMLMGQGGCCPMCGVHYTECKNAFSVDHDHGCCPGDRSCGECVRGLPCHACNVGLGYFKDNIETLKRAVTYLQRFENKKNGDKNMTTSNLFAGLRDAKTFDRGTWLKAGQYEVRVKRAIFKKTRAKGDAYILEFVVEKSTYEVDKKKAIAAFGTTPFDMKELEKALPNQVGTTASWYQSLKDMDIGFGALKAFAASILGQKPEDPEFIEAVEGFMNAVVNEGAINGMLIPVEVVTVKTKADTDFSLHKWGQIIDEQPAAAQAQ